MLPVLAQILGCISSIFSAGYYLLDGRLPYNFYVHAMHMLLSSAVDPGSFWLGQQWTRAFFSRLKRDRMLSDRIALWSTIHDIHRKFLLMVAKRKCSNGTFSLLYSFMIFWGVASAEAWNAKNVHCLKSLWSTEKASHTFEKWVSATNL